MLDALPGVDWSPHAPRYALADFVVTLQGFEKSDVNRPFNCGLLSSTRMAALSKAVAVAPSKLDGVVEMGRERPAIR
ncbi:hypothetical protein [Rhodopseudomonas sp. RCAM05734]|uniref:hypothetical protein n=1 Tax=Rhodopseudomonas sp. RCAM05734 TaxID=3457549 RepID=UPI004045065F